MNSGDMRLVLRLQSETSQFVRGLRNGTGEVNRFGDQAKRKIAEVRQEVGRLMAGLGVSIGAVALATQSARLDKSLTQIGLTAGVSRGQVAGLRRELFDLSKRTGQPVEDLQRGFTNLIAAGVNWRAALQVISATNEAMAVTGAQADALTAGLSVAAESFKFDLSNPGLALSLLDRMVVAGRLGNAELENLSSIFARVGGNASRAGLGFESTLAFIEGLSLIERQPERLATLADSTLRLFTNAKYRADAQKATGVKFFDGTGARREAFDVLADIKKQFDQLKTDQQREGFISRAFGETDLDTQRGLNALLKGSSVDRLREFASQITNASGTISRDVPTALNNAVDQAGRLRTALRKAADEFTQPINRSIARLIAFSQDKQEAGGLGLSGGQTAAWLAVLAGGVLGAGALAKKGMGGVGRVLFGGATGSVVNTATGVAAGKALEAAAGVTPVFVTNWPGSVGGGVDTATAAAAGAAAGPVASKAAGLLGKLGAYFGTGYVATGGSLGVAAKLAARFAGGVGLAGTGGYTLGSVLNKALFEGNALGNAVGEAMARTLALLGNSDAQNAINGGRFDAGGTLNIRIDQDGRARVASMKSNDPGMDFDVDIGLNLLGAQ